MAKQAFLVRDGLRSGSTLVINSAGSWVGNTITEPFGGTNQTTYTEGDILFASGANTLAKLGIADPGDVLTLAGGVPTWAAPTVGIVTSIGEGTLTDISGTAAVPIVDVDLSEAAEAVYAPGTDYLLFLDGGVTGTAAKESGTDFGAALAGVGLVSASGVLAFDAAELGVATMVTGDWIVFDNAGVSNNALISAIPLSLFNDDLGHVENADQDIWLTIAADSGGPVSANTTTDTLTLAGGTNIISTISGDTVTFDWTGSLNDLSDVTVGSPTIGSILFNDGTTWVELDRGTSGQILTMGSPLLPRWSSGSGQPDQNLWLNMNADSGGPVAADTTTDTFVIAGGTGITTAISGDTLTITLAVDELGVATMVTGDWIVFDNAGVSNKALISAIPLSLFNDDLGHVENADQDIWLTIAADSGGPVSANTTTDTLTLTGGDGIATTISGDAVTFDVDATVARMSAGSPVLTNVGTIRVDAVDLGVIGTFATSTLTTTATTEVAVASFAIAIYRSAEYTVQAVQGDNFHTTKLLAIHDDTNADSTEFGTITFPSFFGSPAAGSPATSGEQATYRVDVSGGNLRLLATPTTTSSTVFKVTAQLTTI